MTEPPKPVSIELHSRSKLLELGYESGERYSLSCEFLRVYSPSAEVLGHGPGQEVLQTGKREVTLVELEPIGNYAVKPVFSDGHDTGLFSWDYLYFLGSEQSRLWADYLARLQAAGAERDAPMISGLATLENSSTSNLPPGLSTRHISASARSLWVMLRKPNATDTQSKYSPGYGSFSASQRTHGSA